MGNGYGGGGGITQLIALFIAILTAIWEFFASWFTPAVK